MDSIQLTTKIANRAIFASLAPEVRKTAALLAILKVAKGAEDLKDALGYTALKAMVDAECTGDLYGVPMEDVIRVTKSRPMTTEDRKLKELVLAHSRRLAVGLFNNALKGKTKTDTSEEVASNFIEKVLANNPVRQGSPVPQAIAFLTKALSFESQNVYKKYNRRVRNQTDVDTEAVIEGIMSNPRYWRGVPAQVLQKIERQILKEPAFFDSEGNNRVWTIVDGLIDGGNFSTIAETMGVTPQGLKKWFDEPSRLNKLQKYLQPLQDFIAEAA